MKEPPTGKAIIGWIVSMILLLILLLAVHFSQAHARDVDGRYAQSPNHEWIEKLKSGRGLCCSFADGFVIEDADWDSDKNGHYRVRIPRYQGDSEMVWVIVPDDAVITEPNRIGRTMVWPIWGDEPSIRCFMPGPMT